MRLSVRLENGAVHGSHANSLQLVITIEDDGRGFPLPSSVPGAHSAGRSGLANMRRRVEDLGGRFVIESRPGAGTRIELTMPLETEHDVSRRPRAVCCDVFVNCLETTYRLEGPHDFRQTLRHESITLATSSSLRV